MSLGWNEWQEAIDSAVKARTEQREAELKGHAPTKPRKPKKVKKLTQMSGLEYMAKINRAGKGWI